MHKQNEAGTLLPKTFRSEGKVLDAVLIEGEPWFVARDICNTLAIGQSDKVVKRLDEDEKLTVLLLRSGQKREMWLVNESGLYNLIFRSNKPEAQAFRKWVTHKVLPSIRKTGSYHSAKSLPERRRQHNRLTPQRMLAIMNDVVRIENKSLRESIANKLMNEGGVQ